MLKIQKSTIDRHIQRLGLVKKLDIWIPHELKEIHLTKRINACEWHLKPNEFDPFFKRKLNCNKKRLCCLFNGIGKVCYFLSCFQGTKQFGFLLSSAEQIERNDQRKTARIGES